MPEVIKSENDPRHYRTLRLSNSLDTLLIHDPPPVSETSKSERLSAAALCIGVGSFSDPAELPGLAHFLEHMVFMGSEKYPEENDFDAYVKKHGGGSNAYTDCERTVFYFDVKKEHFHESLDKFAQFFIKPLMKQDSVDREIKAVDSEYDMALPNDHNKKEQLLGSLAKDGHPMAKFMWGNLLSLKIRPKEKGLDLYEHLRKFHDRAYSSHYMTLAVQSRENLDTLEEWVSEIFGAIPHNEQSKPTFHEERFQAPFLNSKFNKLYKAVPMKNVHQVEVTWALPPLLQHYRKKPLNYLGFLLGHEGKGSILSYLKKRYWATGIDGGNGETNFEMNSTWSVCGVCVTLTEEGNQHVLEVLNAVFQYVKMLQLEGPSERVFKEIQTIENNSFRFSDQCEPVDYVERLCENMQLYPSEHFITGDRLLYEYDAELIKQCQDELVPEKASILLYSKSFGKDGVCDMEEEWFHTKYCVEDVPEEWMQTWQNTEPDTIFHLPEENAFIATDFELKEIEEKYVTQQPIKLADTEMSRLWYKKDTKFQRPKGLIYFILKTGIFNQSPANATMGDMLTRILEHNLTEVAYAADVASLSYDFVCLHQNGYQVKLKGFSHKLPKLFETVIDYLVELDVTDGTFDMVKDQLKRTYHNNYIKPSNLVTDVRLSLLQQTHWMPIIKREYLESITIDQFRAFYTQFKSHIFTEGYVHGNFTPEEASNLEQYLLRKLKSSPLPNYSLCERRIVELPVGEHICRVQSVNLADCNSVITNYYQFGPANMYQDVIDDLMVYHMEEPVFDILRTREQLGYSVYASSHNTLETIGYSITTCSQAYKFGMEELNKKMEEFLVEFSHKIDTMSEEDFNKLVDAMVTLKSCQDNNMAEEANRNWTEILDRKYNFERLNNQIDVLKSLELEEFQKWYHSRIPSSGNAKKISIQVVGNPKAKHKLKEQNEDGNTDSSEGEASSSDEDDTQEQEKGENTSDNEEEEMDHDGEESGVEDEEIPETPTDVPAKLTFLPVEEDVRDINITDIKEFKEKLKLYQVTKLC